MTSNTTMKNINGVRTILKQAIQNFTALARQQKMYNVSSDFTNIAYYKKKS